MRNVLGRIVLLLAEALDRNLITVPEIDECEWLTGADANYWRLTAQLRKSS